MHKQGEALADKCMFSISNVLSDNILFVCSVQGATQMVKAVPNRYAPVAGSFIFPLLRNYDRCVYMHIFAFHFYYRY